MAGELRIKPGTKLRMALDVPIGQQPQFNLVCTFVKSLDVASFLISIPMRDGQPMPMDDTRKLLIRYGTDKDAMIVAGYADDVVKEGIRRCDINLPAIGTGREGRVITALAAICWIREAPKGSPFRFVCGYQFRFADGEEREQMQLYVANIKKRYKL